MVRVSRDACLHHPSPVLDVFADANDAHNLAVQVVLRVSVHFYLDDSLMHLENGGGSERGG